MPKKLHFVNLFCLNSFISNQNMSVFHFDTQLTLTDLAMPLLESQLSPITVGSRIDQANTNAKAVSSAEETIP